MPAMRSPSPAMASTRPMLQCPGVAPREDDITEERTMPVIVDLIRR